MARLEEIPISLRLIREMHGKLLEGLPKRRGGKIVPGEFRTTQNWIGATDLDHARFVPPPPNVLNECLADLERYINGEDGQDILIRCALLHYQFETIHPFPDGNGRVGRLLIPLYLKASKLMPQPLLYLNPYFERNHDAYIDLMFAVSAQGAWDNWINFFLQGVSEQSADTILRVERLQDLQREYRTRLQETQRSASALQLMEALFDRPATTIPAAQALLDLTYRAAQSNVEKLRDAGILFELPHDERPRFFVARDIIATINAPFGTLDAHLIHADIP